MQTRPTVLQVECVNRAGLRNEGLREELENGSLSSSASESGIAKETTSPIVRKNCIWAVAILAATEAIQDGFFPLAGFGRKHKDDPSIVCSTVISCAI